MTNIKAKAAVLRNGEKNLRDNVPIRFNEWSSKGAKDMLDLPKAATIKLSILSHHHGTGASSKGKDTSYGSINGLRLDRIEDNPKPVIATWMSIRNELLPRMLDMDAISAVELFQSHLTGPATQEFDLIVTSVADRLYKHVIHKEFNSMCANLLDEDIVFAKTSDSSDSLGINRKKSVDAYRKWRAKNEKRKVARDNVPGVAAYNYQDKPLKFRPPPKQPEAGQFADWDDSGITPLNPMAWLRMHNHGWEYGPQFCNRVFTKVQELAFKSFGTHCGQNQIAYLTEDLQMDPNHRLKNFLRLVEAHSEAQAYYPTTVPVEKQNATTCEVGSIFSADRKARIVWNACYALFKDELVNMNVNRLDDIGGYEELVEKFLLAEQHRQAKLDDKKVSSTNQGKDRRNPKGNKSDTPPTSNASTVICSYCGKKGHIGTNCHSNPQGKNYRGPAGRNTSSGGSAKRQRPNDGKRIPFAEWKKKQTEDQKAYEAYCLSVDNGSDDASEN